MKLHYYKDPSKNFGDEINSWMWEKLLPGEWDDLDPTFLGIGTLIGPGLPLSNSWVVLGTGAGYGPPPEDFGGDNWKILALRGPLSARVLNFDQSLGVTDSAILLASIDEFGVVPTIERNGITFMPHHNAVKVGDWERVCSAAGINYISPSEDSIDVINKIRKSRLVIADAMHAAIVADTFRVPWIAVASSREINTFKWVDWSSSLDLEYSPYRLSHSTLLERIRDIFLPGYGNCFFEIDTSHDSLAIGFQRQINMKSSKYWFLRRNFFHGLYNKFFRRIILSPTFKPITRRFDRYFFERAVDDLKRVVDTVNPKMSDDYIFNDRLAKMNDSLSKLRNR